MALLAVSDACDGKRLVRFGTIGPTVMRNGTQNDGAPVVGFASAVAHTQCRADEDALGLLVSDFSHVFDGKPPRNEVDRTLLLVRRTQALMGGIER
jgi:hypothetical protein